MGMAMFCTGGIAVVLMIQAGCLTFGAYGASEPTPACVNRTTPWQFHTAPSRCRTTKLTTQLSGNPDHLTETGRLLRRPTPRVPDPILASLPLPAFGATFQAQMRPTPSSPDSDPMSRISSDRRIIGFGSGFYINRRGDFVTAHHVIADCAGFAVIADESVLHAALVATDLGEDLAILRTEKNPGPYALLRTELKKVLGKSVYAVGYPSPNRLQPINVTEGFVSSVSKRRFNIYELQTSSPIRNGNSGGPLVDADGAVIGIITARRVVFMNIALITDISSLVQLLNRTGIRFDRAPTAPSADTVTIAMHAKGYTYPIACYGPR